MSSVVRGNAVNKKTVSISQKRQFTIPTQFYEALGFDTKAECMIRGGELIVRPVRNTSGGEFAEQILSGLIKKGYQGEELLTAFKKEQAKVKNAVESMLIDAKSVAEGKSEYLTYDDVFDPEDRS